MENEMQPAYDKEDLRALEALLTKVVAFAPDPKWNEGAQGWSKIASEAAAKAKAGDFKAVQTSCKSCHTAWRKKYRAEHRPRALPRAK
jgi:cytochrome c556